MGAILGHVCCSEIGRRYVTELVGRRNLGGEEKRGLLWSPTDSSGQSTVINLSQNSVDIPPVLAASVVRNGTPL